MNKKQSRKLAALAAAALAVITLAGCSTITYEEAQTSEHRIVETSNEPFAARTWSYYGPSGREVPLTENCRENMLFAQRCYGSVDGTIEFRHSKSKHGSIISESITINGQRLDAECVSDGGWGSDYVCAPTQ